VKSLRKVAVAALATAFAIGGGLLVNPSPAVAHGATIFPGSRQYFCWLDGLQDNGQIIPSNPACVDAVAASGTTPLYNWFGNLHPSNNGGTVGSIPDGRICDGADAGPYDFSPYNMMRPDWPRTHLTAGDTYTFQHNNWAHHPGHFDVYLTVEGWDPTAPLSWSALELIHTEQDPPQSGPAGGLEYYFWNVTFPADRTGQHLVFVHWVRSDSPENFFSCSDVVFDGGNGEVSGLDGAPPPPPPPPPPVCPDNDPTTPGPAIITNLTATSADASWGAGGGCVTAYELVDTSGGSETVLAQVTGDPPATSVSLTGLTPDTSYAIAVRARNDNTGAVSPLTESAPFTTPDGSAPPPPPPPGDCSVSYEFVNQWTPGFHAELVVTNLSDTTINGWAVEWTFADGQQVTQLWNGLHDQSGPAVTVTNETWNPTIPAGGGSVNFGFLGQWSGTNSMPTDFTLNGTLCAVE
jgi:predicted carbohydrate-binding protein with CBM5 and CBM33 domain